MLVIVHKGVSGGEAGGHVYYLGKYCWTVEDDIINGLVVTFHDFLNAFHLRVKHVAIQRETMGNYIIIRRKLSTEAEYGKLLITIVILEYLSNGLDGAYVLIRIILMVKRVTDVLYSIGFRKIDADH